jgi:hypothetical protein
VLEKVMVEVDSRKSPEPNPPIQGELIQALCSLAYETRVSHHYGAVKIKAREEGPFKEQFENIQHYVGRLNHTMKAINFLIDTGWRLTNLFQDFRVARANSPPAIAAPLLEDDLDFGRIVGNIIDEISDGRHEDDYHKVLLQMEQEFSLSM